MVLPQKKTEFSQSLFTYSVLPPKHVEGVVSENATSVQFTVIPTDGFSVNNYTLLYCHGHLINGIPDEQKCRVSNTRFVSFQIIKQLLYYLEKFIMISTDYSL